MISDLGDVFRAITAGTSDSSLDVQRMPQDQLADDEETCTHVDSVYQDESESAARDAIHDVLEYTCGGDNAEEASGG